MVRHIVLLLMGLLLPAAALAEPQSDCSNPAPWKHMDELVERYRGTTGERDVLYLRNLRRFVCDEIEGGRLAQPAGTALFDSEKQRLVTEWARSGRARQAF